MEDCLDTDIEESLNIAAKDWDRIINAAKKTGYREGMEHGSDSVFQEGFDKGYEEAFETAFILGKFKSLQSVMPQNTKHPQKIIEILDKTRRGACRICTVDSENKNDTRKPFSQVIDEQRAHSSEAIQTLNRYFQPYVERLNMNESNLLEIQNHVAGSSKDN